MTAAVLFSFLAGCVLGVWTSTALTATLSRRGAVCPAAPLENSRAGLARSGGGGSARQNRRGCRVQSKRSMLTTLQQDAVSALMNQGASFGVAEGAVLAATAKGHGQSFDEVFRVALALVNAARKGAAC